MTKILLAIAIYLLGGFVAAKIENWYFRNDGRFHKLPFSYFWPLDLALLIFFLPLILFRRKK